MAEEGVADEQPSVLALDDPVVVLDGDLRVRDWNDALASVLASDASLDTNSNVEDVIGATATAALRDCLPAQDGDYPTTCTTTLGVDEDREFEIRVHRTGDRYACVLRDVTDDGERRRELERRETVLEALPTPVYYLNDDSRFEYANQALADMLDIPLERFLNEHTSVEMGMPPEDMTHARRLTAELLSGDPETGDSTTFEMTSISRNAGKVPCENNMAIVLDEDGDFVGTVGTLRDITDERRLEQRIEVLERVLRHNLRTEVMIIDGHAEMVEAVANDPTLVDAVDRIRAACDRLVEIGNRTQYVGDAIAKNTDDSSLVLHETVRKAADAVRASHPEVPIEVSVDESLRVAAGRSLYRAIVELLTNAIVHNDAEDPRVEVTARTADANTVVELEGREEQVVLQIRDNGPGIPAHERAVLTEGGSETNLQHSDGLGLWMASWVVEAYGGHLTFSDADPRGTVVELSLPKALDSGDDDDR